MTTNVTGGPLFDTRHIADLGRDAASLEPFTIDTAGLGPGLPATIPTAWDRKAGRVVDLRPTIEALRQLPARRTGTAKVLTLQSFIDLTNRHKDDHTVIFANTDWKSPTLTAVIDYHQTDALSRHLQHRILYAFPISEEWSAWTDQNGTVMDQGEFAAFVEDRLAELATPHVAEREELERLFQTKLATPAELMQLSRGLQVNVGINVKTAKTLQTGEAEIIYEESHRDSAGNKLIVPGLFIIKLPVFVGGEPVRLPARLRYRAAGGGIKWFFQLYRPDVYVTERIRADLALAANATERPSYEGTPES